MKITHDIVYSGLFHPVFGNRRKYEEIIEKYLKIGSKNLYL